MDVREVQSYIERGWNIIPLVRGTKIPPKGFDLDKYYHEKYPADALLSACKNDINIGLMTGVTSGIAVIDVDDPDKITSYLSTYPTEMIQKTPNNGLHLLYEYDTTLPTIRKIDGGDFFAGEHYIVVSPSEFEGKSYTWMKQGSLGKLPKNLELYKPEFHGGKYSRQDILGLLNYALQNLAFKDDHWNDTVLYGSMILSGDGWTKEAIYNLFSSINKRGSEPIPDKQIQSMIERSFEYSKDNVKPEKTKKEIKDNVDFKVHSYLDMQEKYDSYAGAWLIEEWIPESSIIICSALPERYKTWLSIDLAVSVASGLPFLDVYEVNKQGNVLVVQQEDFAPEFVARFKLIERAKLARANIEFTLTQEGDSYELYMPYDISDKLFFHEDAELSLDNDLSLDRLEERIVENNIKLCVIDPFYSLSVNDDYFAKAAGRLRDRIKGIRDKTGCTFFFVHHNKKSGSRDGTDNLERGQIWGSTFVSAVMEGAWTVGRDNDMGENEVAVQRRFKTKQAGSLTKIKFHIQFNSEDDSKAYWLEVEDVSVDDLKEAILQYLRDNGASRFTDLYDNFKEKYSSRSAFARRLKKIVGNGIMQDSSQKYRIEVL